MIGKGTLIRVDLGEKKKITVSLFNFVLFRDATIFFFQIIFYCDRFQTSQFKYFKQIIINKLQKFNKNSRSEKNIPQHVLFHEKKIVDGS